jgi:hypothetical protein
MLNDSSDEAWKHVILVDNLLQKKIQTTSKRMGNLILHRLEMGILMLNRNQAAQNMPLCCK